MSDTRDFLKLFLWQAERHADILASILARMSARMSVSVSASWNASFIIYSSIQESNDELWSDDKRVMTLPHTRQLQQLTLSLEVYSLIMKRGIEILVMFHQFAHKPPPQSKVVIQVNGTK